MYVIFRAVVAMFVFLHIHTRYDDFDIVYGDYDDYVSTRRRMIIVPDKDLLTQEEIDELISMIK